MLPHDERGTGQTVLLLHAGVADRSMWDEHLGWLADQGFRAIAVDLPGFGDAAVGDGPQAPWDDVLATLRELQVDRAVLVGNSFGAAVALRVAVVAPAAVSGLMLISPPPVGPDDPSPALQAAWEAEEAALERGDVEAAVAAVIDAWLRPSAPAGLRERIAAMQRRALVRQMAAGEVEEAADPLERRPGALAELSIPVLAVAGEADLPDFVRGAEEIARLTPQGQATTLTGAGHLAPLEVPEAFQELLLRFLRAGT